VMRIREWGSFTYDDTLRTSLYPLVFENTCMVLVLVFLGKQKGKLMSGGKFSSPIPTEQASQQGHTILQRNMLAGQPFKYRMCLTARHVTKLREVCKGVQEYRTQHNLVMMAVNMGIWPCSTEEEKINMCPMSCECLRERFSGILRYGFHMLNRRKNRTQEMNLSPERKILGK
jgi:hypothetical protein